jgi:hypothetical protein
MAENDDEIRYEQPRSTFGTWLGVVLLFAVFALFVWAVMGAMPRGDSYEQKRAEERVKKAQAVREEASKSLSGYAWADKDKGLVRLPIDRAMEVTVADLAQKKPTAANPIPPEGDKMGQQATAPVAPTPAAVGTAAPVPTPHTAIEGKDSETKGKAAAAANPPNVEPGTQPGPSASPAASPAAPASQPNVGEGHPTATPVQSPPGTPLPVPGTTPR